jgi:hypothetical protein
MKFIPSVRVCLIPAVLLLTCLSVPELHAQQRDAIRVKSVKIKKLKTPEYQTRPSFNPRLRDWIEITTEYEIQKDWMDELEMTYYVLLKGGKDKTIKEPYTLLQGSIAYVHIEKARELKSIMYVHPSVLTRFGDVDAVAVEVKQSGRPSIVDGMGTWQQWQKWVQQLTARGGMILAPDQTPFGAMSLDDSEMIRPVAR